MEALIVVVALVALAVAAECWGYDSRDGIRSKEQELATRGITWDDLVPRSPAETPSGTCASLRGEPTAALLASAGKPVWRDPLSEPAGHTRVG
jgi:hypothetical protein